MVCNSKNIDCNEQDFVVPTSLIIKSTACLIIGLIFFFNKFSIKNRFLYKNFFFSFAPTSSSAAHDDDGDTDEKDGEDEDDEDEDDA